MKNATKHAESLKSLYKRLMRDGKPPALQKIEPLEALVRAVMSFDVPDERANEAMRQINKSFVDLNELRVATDLEIGELVGTRYPMIIRRAEMVTRALNAIFEREHTLNLNRLAGANKKESRQFLRDLPEMTPFVEAYVMLFAFESPAIPLDDSMLTYLRDEDVVDAESTLHEAQKFVEHQFKSDECYDFFMATRKASLRQSDEETKSRKKIRS